MSTIGDVAREAGVGVGTVSRVLNGGSNVAPETRRRVEEAIERLGYRPNPVARGLRTRRTHTLEVLVPLFTRHFYVEVLRGIEMGLANTNYGLLIRSVEKQADRDRAFASSGLPGHADGVIIVSLVPTPDLVERLHSTGCPTVLVDAEYEGLPSVTVDHEAASARATTYLLKLGHRRIGLIDRAEDPFTPGYPGARREGYRRAHAEVGMPLRPRYEIVTDFSPAAGAEGLHTLMTLPEPPTAVFVGSDSQAIGVLGEARRRGLNVPGDLSVVGYNDIELSQYLALSTMRVPMCEMGQRGVETMLAWLDDPGRTPRGQSLQAELVVRRTTGSPGR